MIISDLNELNAIDSSCYTPVDVSGDTKKIQASLLTPNIANNLTTTSAGYVLDAAQGKALNDAIQANAEDIAEMDATVNAGTIFNAQPWTLSTERSSNSSAISYPSDANEIMIVAWDNDVNEYFTGIFIPGMTSDTVNLLLGGYYQYSSGGLFARVYVSVNPTAYTVGSVAGMIRYDVSASTATQIGTSSSWSTQIWYR